MKQCQSWSQSKVVGISNTECSDTKAGKARMANMLKPRDVYMQFFIRKSWCLELFNAYSAIILSLNGTNTHEFVIGLCNNG